MPGNRTSSGKGKRGSSQTATEEDAIVLFGWIPVGNATSLNV